MPARTATVTNICAAPGLPLKPLTKTPVTAKLNTIAFTVDGTTEKAKVRYADVDPVTGVWSMVLEINDDLDPVGTSWIVKEPTGATWTIQLTAAEAGLTVNLRAAIVADPTNPNPIIAGVSQAQLDTAVASVVGAAPGTLDTLKELADALGDDPNYAATVAGLIGGKVSSSLLGAANGVATLDGAGVVAQVPKLHAARHAPGGADDLSGSYVAQSTATAKGDLLAATAAGALARLGVGADARLLLADSTQSAGVRWGTSQETVARALGWFIATDSRWAGGADPTGATDSSAAFQAAITACGAAGGGVIWAPAGDYLVNTSLTWPLNKIVRLQGVGFSASGPMWATRLRRTGTNPIIAAAGTGQATNQRVYPEFVNIAFNGGGAASGDVVQIARASHALLDRVRVTNSFSTGVHLTEVWDSHIPLLIVEACGSGTTSPALLFDSVVGGGANANCATIQIGSLILQSNFGTDLRLTGSTADGSICNDIEVAMLKMEGTGSGTSGSPDTYPYIDLDYAQNCQFGVTRVSIPTGRAPTAVLQQIGSSGGGPRANQFALLTLDAAGSNSPQRYIDWSSGALMIGILNVPSNQPTVEYLRLTGSAGRFQLGTFNHNSPSPASGLITDSRTINEELAKGHLQVFPPRASGSATAATLGNALVYGFATGTTNDATTQIVIPRDAHPSGQMRLRLLWTSSATTGNVHWRATSKAYAAGADASAAGSVFETVVAAPSSANALQITTLSSGPTPAPGGVITVFLQRMATQADDTMAATANLIAAELVYDRRR